MKQAHLIEFQQIGKPSEGFLVVGTALREIPFEIQRAFITHHTPPEVIRGRHAHHQTEMVLICVKGKIDVHLEEKNGKTSNYILDNCQYGLYIPPMCWHSMQYEAGSIQLVYCSTFYNEEDYIRNYNLFKSMISK